MRRVKGYAILLAVWVSTGCSSSSDTAEPGAVGDGGSSSDGTGGTTGSVTGQTTATSTGATTATSGTTATTGATTATTGSTTASTGTTGQTSATTSGGDAAADVSIDGATGSTGSDAKSDAPLSCPSFPDGGSGILPGINFDAGTPPTPSDAAPGDGATSDAAGDGEAGAGPQFPFPPDLVATGLYCNIATYTVAPENLPFRPQFELWSDGASKARWIYLPPGTQIDTSNPDHWSFPVGTRIWKEFTYAGKRIETRLIVRYGTGVNDFAYAAYQWNAGETAATLAPAAGVKDASPIFADAGTPTHDIPAVADCVNCHGKLREHVLGFSAIQLSHNLGGGENITSLAMSGKLSVPPEAAAGYPVPGTAAERAALGSLHANCGNCHNDTGIMRPNPFRLRLLVGQATVADTDALKTAVNVLHNWTGPGSDAGGFSQYRIMGGNADQSELYYRMGIRGTGQMPSLGTKVVDTAGRAALATWINTLPPPPEAGPPDAAVDAGASDSAPEASVDAAGE